MVVDHINILKVVEAPGNPDELFALRVDMSEGLSQLYTHRLLLSSHGGLPKAIDWLGQSFTFSIGSESDKAFKVNGQVIGFEVTAIYNTYTEFTIDVAPALWTTQLSQNCRIFQGKNVRQIIAEVLKDYPDVVFEDICKASYPVRDYCLQYRESDFDFICRLMEEEGIFYFFKFGPAGRYQHKLYLGDDTSAYFEGTPKLLQYRQSEHSDNIHSLSLTTGAIVGKRTTRAYDYLAPAKKLQAEVPSKLKWADARTESYDYPLWYTELNEGTRQATLFMEREEAWSALIQGDATYSTLVPGGKHEISDEQLKPYHKKIVMISVQQSIHDSQSSRTGMISHSCFFSAIPSDVTFRPKRQTPRPMIPGTQRAVVVGPPGEEIHTDEHGRIKVQFMWDREGKKDANSSCWIRYMQQWAGPGYGAQWIPRIGHEVLVSFLEGDPDQPVVIGSLYNGANKVPFELKSRETQSGWRTVSSKGKGKRQELIFEDKAGSEEIYMYGGRNHRVVFDSNESIKIGANQANLIGADQSTVVGGNRQIEVKKNQATTVKGNTDLVADGDINLSAGMGMVKYSMSNGSFDLKSAMSINIEAGMTINLKAGASSISISPAGISITGMPFVLINSGGAAASANADAKKAKVQAVLDKLADRKMKGGEGGWTDPRKLGSLSGNPALNKEKKNKAPPGGMTEDEATNWMRDFKKKRKDIPFDWPRDCCFTRAHEMSKQLKKEGFEPGKVWNYPSKPVPSGGRLKAKTPNVPEGEVKWTYHVAPTVPIRRNDGTVVDMVIDPSLSDKPLTKDEWKSLMGDKNSTLESTSDKPYGPDSTKMGYPGPMSDRRYPGDPEAANRLQQHRNARDKEKKS